MVVRRRLMVAALAVLVSVVAPTRASADPAAAGCTGLEVGVADKSGPEGTVGQVPVIAPFTVTATGCASGAVEVHYATGDGTAKTASPFRDYDSRSGTLTWAAGESSAKTVEVPVIRDGGIEGDEAFFVNLTLVGGNATVVKAQAVGTILDDDDPLVPPVVSMPDGGTISWHPDDSQLGIAVAVSHTVEVPVVIRWRTVDGTAHAGRDFTGVTDGAVTIQPGQLSARAVVRAAPDADPRPGAYFVVELTSTSLGVVDGGRTTVTFAPRG